MECKACEHYSKMKIYDDRYITPKISTITQAEMIESFRKERKILEKLIIEGDE